MMHHPNMHHQAMSGHPPQHMPGHQPMPTHHQIPHQMHRENRHVTLTRVPLGPSQAGGGMGAHGQAMGGMGPGGMGVPHHGGPQRAPHPIRAMPHHPPGQHHSVPPPMKALRRPYGVGAVYGGNAAGVMPQYAQPPPPLQPPPTTQPSHTMTTASTASTNIASSKCDEASEGVGMGVGGVEGGAGDGAGEVAAGGGEAARPAAANSKEKTPMCLVNELARYNKIKHQYRLTSETGPAHKKVFTVTLRLGDTEEYTAEGSSIKRAQHAAASAALGGTRYPPPPPRAPPAHQPHHPHHRHSVMPTVELNALAMKLCQPAIYTSIPPVAAGGGHAARLHAPRPYRMHAPFPGAAARMIGPGLVYRVRVCVGGRAWLGEGGTPQAARHDAAARALHDLRPSQPAARPVDAPSDSTPPDTDGGGEPAADLLSSEVKSPVSLVHELALKRNLAVTFTVKSERGPPHMRVFVTQCAVGELETEGEGNGKKVSKRRAAERMLDEMRRRWPPALLRARPPLALDKRRQHAAKKKPRNLIKEGGGRSSSANGSTTGGEAGADNPISRLAVARHAMRARSPQYRVVEERGAARRREFLVQCDAPPHSATGLGPNKKTAKRRAAHNVLLAMEMSANPNEASATNGPGATPVADSQPHVTNGNKSNGEKRKEAELNSAAANGELRQPVPGVLMMDYHQRPPPPAGSPPTGTPGAKDQLLYLSQLLGFTVQFSDFPKRNHGEYLSLVSLSTTPPVMCHGGGPSTAHSHEQCSLSALQSLKNMGLDAPTTGAQTTSSAAAKQTAIVNGVAE